ncbi:MAG: amino acid ABC transporter permease [Hyphomicrobiales bacterium]
MSNGYVRKEMLHELPAPDGTKGIFYWLKTNLFSTPLNALATFIALYVIYKVVPPVIDFALISPAWFGENREVCATLKQGGVKPDDWFGACWPYVGANMKLFIYGRYPPDEIWRVNIVYLMFAISGACLLIPKVPYKLPNLLFMFGVFPVAAFVLLTGGHVMLDGFLVAGSFMGPSFAAFWVDFLILTCIFIALATFIARGTDSDPMPSIRMVILGMVVLAVVMAIISAPLGLEHVETEIWGGLLVTLVIAVSGIVASLPIGILLALGRRSKMPAVKMLSVMFIEFWRGVPLITVLFMSSVMLPLFLPEGVTFDKLLRALIGVTLFQSAYMAEVIRGGIQALPKGQYEGAMALGLNYWQMIQKIILPQALTLVIPGIVNTFIGLFKDTTLVLIIGLFDFLGQIQSSFSDPTWATPVQAMSGYLFAAVIYWIFCFSMSRYSIFMEQRLDTGHRN